MAATSNGHPSGAGWCVASIALQQHRARLLVAELVALKQQVLELKKSIEEKDLKDKKAHK